MNTDFIYTPSRFALPDSYYDKLAADIALLLTCADREPRAEVYSCASDRRQASIVFDVACDMVDQCRELRKFIKPIISEKKLIYKPLNSFYQVLSYVVIAFL